MGNSTQPLISCRNLAVGYDGTPVLSDLSFTVTAGETVALVGRSGCGKTTLLKTVAGIIEPLAGEARVLDSTYPDRPPNGTLGYIPQRLGLVTHGTVFQNVLHGTLPDLGRMRSVLGRFPPDTEARARTAIEEVGLAEMEHRRVNALSGGQQRRVAIARAFVQRPRVILADEMLSELDDHTADSIVTCLETLQDRTGMAIIIVEHDRSMAEAISDRLLKLADGHIQEIIDTTESAKVPP